VGPIRGRSRRRADATATPLDGLLEQMLDLRLTLAADLNAAAGAAEAGATDVAADIVEADRRELARFARVADMRMARLQRLAVAEPSAPRWRRRIVIALPAVPLVGAMAVSAAAVTGVLPLPNHHHAANAPVQSASTSPVTSTFQQFVSIVDSQDASASQVIAAADALHRQLAAMIAGSGSDPSRAAEVAELLRWEQSLLMQAQPPGASVVLDATRRLAAQLVNATPVATPTANTLPKTLPSPSPTAKTTVSPAPKKTTSSPKPSQSTSKSSPSPGSGQIPSVP